jgi:hypothetical protein
MLPDNYDTLLFIKKEAARLADALKTVEVSNFPDEVAVNNFDEVKAHLRNELVPFLKNIEKAVHGIKIPEQKEVKIPETVKVSNLSEIRLEQSNADIIDALRGLSDQLKAIEINPTVNVSVPEVVVPEIRLPEINVPKTETSIDIDMSPVIRALKPLELLSDKPSQPIAVRISDGKAFVKAMERVSQGMTTFTSSVGMSVDELKAVIAKLNLEPKYDQQVIDESAAPNVTITYKLAGATVFTKTITVVGAVTTITVS